MVVKRWTLATLLGALGTAGCTVYDLSDRIHQEQCEWKFEPLLQYDECEVLNDRTSPNFDRCNPWRCGEKNLCEVAPLDQDRDGFTPTACLDSGDQGDCDDSD